jgi:hypothetical protein
MSGKYEALYSDVFSIFSIAPWTNENISTYPENFVGDGGNEYIRVSILPSGFTDTNSIKSVSGQILIEIFFPAGSGPQRGRQIADRLDAYLAGKLRTGTTGRTTQLFSSTLVSKGNDSDNPALYRMLYSIPFNHFGA